MARRNADCDSCWISSRPAAGEMALLGSNRVKRSEVKEIFNAAVANVSVQCNEFHRHSSGCLDGDPKDIQIVQLCEELMRISAAQEKFQESIFS